jgi:hypothetical protein
MSSSPILILTQKAEVKQGKLVCETVNLDVIQKYFKKKTEVDMIGSYLYKGLTLFLFGYTKGKAGNENKHELPPPHDATLVFGDIIIIASKDPNSFSTAVPFKVEDYEQFYSKAFGGFEDLDEEEEDYEEEEDEEEEQEENILDEDVETLKKSNRVIIQLDSLKKLINYTEDDIISQINKNPYFCSILALLTCVWVDCVWIVHGF